MDCSKVLGASTTLRWSALVVCRCQGDVSNGRTSAVELVRGRSGLGSEPSLAAADDSKRNSVFVVMYTITAFTRYAPTGDLSPYLLTRTHASS
jgi:hypothetical protein